MGTEQPTVGILAFGTLIDDPGDDIALLIKERLIIPTPFNIEFGRYSWRTRGGAPTLVPVTKGGASVSACVFVLKGGTTRSEATNTLWWRETRTTDKRRIYPASRTPHSVRVRALRNFGGLDIVLYTDFYATGKIRTPKPRNLARRAIASVNIAPEGSDGISYLIAARNAGVKTPLSEAYVKEIMKQTDTTSLQEALAKEEEKRDPNRNLQRTR